MIRDGKVWILTATDGYLGVLRESPSCDDPRYGGHYTIIQASWVAETGRRSTFLAKGVIAESEVEVYPPDLEVDIPLAAVIAVCRWPHPLPSETQ